MPQAPSGTAQKQTFSHRMGMSILAMPLCSRQKLKCPTPDGGLLDRRQPGQILRGAEKSLARCAETVQESRVLQESSFFQPIALTPNYYTRVSEHRKRVQADSKKADIRKEFQGKMNEIRTQIEALEEERAKIDKKLQEADAKLNSLWNDYMKVG